MRHVDAPLSRGDGDTQRRAVPVAFIWAWSGLRSPRSSSLLPPRRLVISLFGSETSRALIARTSGPTATAGFEPGLGCALRRAGPRAGAGARGQGRRPRPSTRHPAASNASQLDETVRCVPRPISLARQQHGGEVCRCSRHDYPALQGTEVPPASRRARLPPAEATTRPGNVSDADAAPAAWPLGPSHLFPARTQDPRCMLQ